MAQEAGSARRVVIACVAALVLAPAAADAREGDRPMPLGSKLEELITAKITVGDLQRSYDFYTRLVGLKPTDPEEAAAGLKSTADFVEIGLNPSGSRRDPALMLIRRKGDAPDKASAQRTWIAFKTPDVAAAVARIKAAGFEVRNEATPYQDLTFGIVHDPDGYTVEFLAERMAKQP
jgi:catechol 2,3-dioxygenase-like lactoylglutathione lyase family enzyme